ncbi:MAG: hypothetical protein D3925_11160, partial [Candidatus Electrothrix sp. AR5]|nr:hypothetical protein [Candidatus Electrothrix sp. AR5]
MKLMQKITPRIALFISLGILLYIALAGYHAHSKKKHEEQIAATQRREQTINLQSKVIQYRKDLADAQSEGERLRTELSRVQRKAHTRATIEQETAASIAVAQEAESTISAEQLRKAEFRIKQMQEQLASAKRKLSSEAEKENSASRKLLQKIKEREQELQGKKVQLVQMQERRRADLQTIAQLKKIQQKKAEQVKQTKQQVVELTSRLEQSKAQFEQEQQKKTEQIKATEQRVVELTGRLAESKARLADATTKLSVANNDMQKAQLKAEAMLQYGKEKDRMLAPSEQKAATLEQQFVDQQAQIKQLTAELAKARKKVKKGNANNQQLAEQVTSLNATGVGRQKELATLKEQLQKSGREQREKQIAFTSQEAALTEAQARLEKLTAEKESLAGKVDKLSEVLKAQKTLKQAAFEKEKLALHNNIVQLTVQLTKKEKEMLRQKELLAEAASRMTTLQKAEEKSQLKIEALLKYGKEKERLLAPAQAELEKLTAEKESLTEKADKLSA